MTVQRYDFMDKKHFVMFDDGTGLILNLSQIEFWFEKDPSQIFRPQLTSVAQVEHSTVDDMHPWEKVRALFKVSHRNYDDHFPPGSLCSNRARNHRLS